MIYLSNNVETINIALLINLPVSTSCFNFKMVSGIGSSTGCLRLPWYCLVAGSMTGLKFTRQPLPWVGVLLNPAMLTVQPSSRLDSSWSRNRNRNVRPGRGAGSRRESQIRGGDGAEEEVRKGDLVPICLILNCSV